MKHLEKIRMSSGPCVALQFYHPQYEESKKNYFILIYLNYW